MGGRSGLGSVVRALLRGGPAKRAAGDGASTRRRGNSAAVGCLAEPLEGRLLMALAAASGGSGYSGTLSNNKAIRQQQLTCDPDEPLGGSTSVRYDPRLVTLVNFMAGPGYENANFGGAVEVRTSLGGTMLQPIGAFLQQRAGEETGYVQIRYQLTGDAGQIPVPQNFDLLDERGVAGVDTHALRFQFLPEVDEDTAEPVYTIFANVANANGGNPQDFLILNDGRNTRLGPEELTPATVFTNPKDVEAPGVRIENVEPDPRNTPVDSLGILFTESVDGFDLADLSLTLDGGPNLLTPEQALTGDGVRFKLEGLQPLTDKPGTYTLSVLIGGADVIDKAGNPLAKGAQELWTVDLTRPAVVSSSFDFTGSNRVLFTFSEGVGQSLLSDDLELVNLTTRETFRPDALTVSYDPLSNTASFALASGPLPNGNYKATLLPRGVTDAAGNELAAKDTVLEFYALRGDINRDRAVNGTDFSLLVQGFGRTGQTYAMGDLTGEGDVNGTDFAILAANFGLTVPEPPPAVSGAAVASTAEASQRRSREAKTRRAGNTQAPLRGRQLRRALAAARRGTS